MHLCYIPVLTAILLIQEVCQYKSLPLTIYTNCYATYFAGMKKIIVNHGLRKQMMMVLNVTYPTIRAALAFESDTFTAKCIRFYALEHGGVLVKEIQDQEQ